jgi:polyphosphate kinase
LLNSSAESNQNKITLKETLDNPDYFLNRELSWVRFNARVLEEAHDQWHPLLERIKFLAICGSNLDEFFMTRIPRLIKLVNKGSSEKALDGQTPLDQILATHKEILPIVDLHTDCWKKEIVPALAHEEIHLKRVADLPEKTQKALRQHFETTILPNLNIPNKGINSSDIENLHVCLYISGFSEKNKISILDIPAERFGRLIRVSRNGTILNIKGNLTTEEYWLVFLEDLIESNLDLIFPNEKELVTYPFRLTRNGEINILMDESADFLSSVKESLSKRKAGFPSRLECSKTMPIEIQERLAGILGLSSYFVYSVENPLGLVDLWQLLKINRPDLKDKTFLPSVLPLLTSEKNLFATITKKDIVLYHPYDGFEVIIDLLKEAARDPHVQSICITMYRVDHDSPIIAALMDAVGRGKKVTVLIELKAKFDEENNLRLTTQLKEAGVNVIYNFPNIKVHAKLCLIERKEKNGIARYCHIGSGNYNAATAKIYGDIGYLTANKEVGEELEELFNILINGLQEKEFKHFLVAPKTLKHEILERIDREIAFHKQTGNGYIAFKLNNLEEKEVIQALYKASIAGIKIDLNVRGLCCLKPGIAGISENISVVSIVGRFLEHARIYYFHAGEEVLVGSSDLMFRNLNERVEVLFSVPDSDVRKTILENMLKIHLKDNVKARRLLPNGTYERVTPKHGETNINSQFWLIQNRGIWHEYNTCIPHI